MSYGKHPHRTAAGSAAPPSGWYLDPGSQQVLRWWNGAQWHSHTRPIAAETPVPGHVSGAGPWVWIIAAIPLTGLIVAAGLAAVEPGVSLLADVAAVWITSAIPAFIAAIMDTRALGAAVDRFYPRMAGLCLLLSGWAYLLARAIKRRGCMVADLGSLAAWAQDKSTVPIKMTIQDSSGDCIFQVGNS